MNQPIITISREYGSGGREIGRKLADLLGVPLYDREVVELAARENGVDAEAFEQLDKGMRATLYSIAMLDPNNENDRLFALQARAIRTLAEKGPCVFVGRCADYVLRDFDHVYHVFISSNSLKKVNYIGRRGLFCRKSERGWLEEINEMDRRRKGYYEHYTGRPWGAASNYHLCIDSSVTGAATAEVIRCFVEKSEEQRRLCPSED